jgi:hypothetical protein
MADEARLHEFLDLYEQAMAEGDQETAAKAKAAYQAESAGQTLPGNAAPQQAAPEQQQAPKKEGGWPTPLQYVTGAVDTAATLASSGIAQIASGVAGAAVAPFAGMDAAATVQKNVQDLGTWSPKSRVGRMLFETAGEVLEPAMLKMRDIISLEGKTNPALAAAIETGLLGVPEIFFGSKLGKGVIARYKLGPQLQKQMADGAKRMQIDLNNNTVRPTTIEAGRRMAGDNTSRGTTGIEDIQTSLQAAAKTSRDDVNALYTAARETTAQIQYEPIREATDAAFATLRNRGMNLRDMKYVDARIKDLMDIDHKIPNMPRGKDMRVDPADGVMLGPDGRQMAAHMENVPLNDLEIVNQTINSNIKTVGKNSPEGAALIELRKHINREIDRQFDKDMISGDPTAKEKWKKANLANQKHKERFHEDKVIGRLVTGEYTPEEVARLLLGASETKHQTGAVKTVRKLKTILGPNAPELDAIKTAIAVDLFDPMFKDDPNFKGVAERIRQVEKNNAPLLREVGLSKADLEIMRRAALAAESAYVPNKADPKGIIASMFSRYTAGHEIAQAAVRVRVVNYFADRLLGVGQKTHKQLLSEFTGDELSKNPLIANMLPDKRAMLLHAAAVAELQQAGEDPDTDR